MATGQFSLATQVPQHLRLADVSRLKGAKPREAAQLLKHLASQQKLSQLLDTLDVMLEHPDCPSALSREALLSGCNLEMAVMTAGVSYSGWKHLRSRVNTHEFFVMLLFSFCCFLSFFLPSL